MRFYKLSPEIRVPNILFSCDNSSFGSKHKLFWRWISGFICDFCANKLSSIFTWLDRTKSCPWFNIFTAALCVFNRSYQEPSRAWRVKLGFDYPVSQFQHRVTVASDLPTLSSVHCPHVIKNCHYPNFFSCRKNMTSQNWLWCKKTVSVWNHSNWTCGQGTYRCGAPCSQLYCLSAKSRKWAPLTRDTLERLREFKVKHWQLSHNDFR